MGRTPCCDNRNGLKKGPWTPEEDHKLVDYIQKHGYGNWRTLPKNAGLQRCGKSCRLRWTNYLRPDIKRGRFSFEEEEAIIQLHSVLGNKWSAIAARLPGRTDNEIKNYWNTHIRKRLLRMGIDPVTHNPRLDLLDLSSLFTSHLYNQTHTSNLSRLLGVVDPQLLKLATSLISNQNHNHDHLHQHHHHSNNLQQLDHDDHQGNYNNLMISNNNTISNSDDVVIPCTVYDQDQLGSSDQWLMQNNYQLPSFYDYDQTEPGSSLSEPSNLHNNVSTDNYYSGNLGFSTPPTSSPSTALNYSSSATTYTDQDERESYCSGLLKFEVPDLLDVTELL